MFHSDSKGQVYIVYKDKLKSRSTKISVLNTNKELIEVCSSIRSAAKKYQLAANTLRYSYLDKNRLYDDKYYFISA